MSEAAASLCPCSSRASPGARRPGAYGALSPPAQQRSRPARSQWSPSTPAPPRWLDCWRYSRRYWCSTPVARCAWPLAAVSALGPRIRFDECSAGWSRRDGSCGTRSRVAVAGISTTSRSPRPASRSQSRPRRGRSMHATWPAPETRLRGCADIGSVGAVEGRSLCCALCTPAGLSTSAMKSRRVA